MATVVPVPSNDQGNDEYVLSIIVFSSRNVNSVDKWNEVDAEVANVPERTCDIIFPGGGYTGGEVELSHRIPGKFTTAEQRQLYAENILKLQTNSWVMLSGTSGGRKFFRWYRVLNVGSIVPGTASRPVTLQGADWELAKTHSLANPNTKATIMEGVVGVFEKRIRLETSSLW
ncbi:MAG TPA: hypothetical protein EYN03_10835 [Planctomycetes bacterium]|nr:hypothetical protein [Planctomycetota bacterium]